MPKAEKGSAKDLANRMKAKGLQKLKFYCQMCERQMRDANGFKCHLTSESHLRQMKIFSENAKGIMDRYSKEFESSYLQTLRQRHTTKRVNANNVYQEVIADKQHIHMNSTRWVTLGDFVQYLGKQGKCVVEETERGWYIQYIERDAGILARQEALERRVDAEKAAEEAQAKRMELQRIEAAKALDRAGGTVHTEATKLDRDSGMDVSLALNVTKKRPTNSDKLKTTAAAKFFFDDDDEEENNNNPESPAKLPNFPPPLPKDGPPRKRPKVEEADGTTKSDNKHKDYVNGRDRSRSKHKAVKSDNDNSNEEPWLRRDIVVRIISKTLADGKYFKRKGIIDRILDADKKDKKFGFTAEVEVLDSGPDVRDGGDILRLDQNDLETVVPREGKTARIVRGKYRGEKAKVISLDKKRYCGTLELLESGKILEKMDYEEFSKIS